MAKSTKKSKKKEPHFLNAKEEKLFNNLLKITEQFMGGKSFIPLLAKELMERLSIPPQHEPLFKKVLEYLHHANLIEIVNGRYKWKQSRTDIMTGTLKMHPRGFGFVQPDNPILYPQDIFIPKHLTKNAVDGDVVEVFINQDSISDKGPEGKVTAILSRARTHMAGIIRHVEKNGTLIAHVPLLGMQQRVVVESTEEHPLQLGDRIVMEVIDWGTKETETICRFSHYLGHISDPSCDIYAAIEEFELRADFPNQVIEEADQLGKQVSKKEIKDREDLRHLTTFTIDPDTAKDFDDALSLTKDSHGIFHLGVHIADVSHYVLPGTAIDEEARLRCNSTYFPNICLPMLPSSLSENLCSLKPNVNRLTISVFMRFDHQGNLLDHRISRTVIRSAKRFTYKEAKKVLEGKSSPHAETLHLMVDLCRLLKKKRYERGSIEFSLPELVVLVDEKGNPYKTDYITYDITHQMVEEFMLKANEIVALDLTLQSRNLTYRVHDEPAEENLRDFALLAAAFGFRLPDRPTSQDLQKLFEEAGETPYANYLASSFIRRLRLASYSAENIGHYGLSLTHYCHFTSPIRRYIDLVIHRILFGQSEEKFEYLQKIAHDCSEQERISAKAESSVILLKKLRLLKQYYEKEPFKEYEAIITRIKNFGIYFEIIDLLLEGFIHISELEEDYFVFEEAKMRLRGTRRGNVYAPGDRLTVMLKEVDFISQETKWYAVYNQPLENVITIKKQHKKKSAKPSGERLLKKWSRKKAMGRGERISKKKHKK